MYYPLQVVEEMKQTQETPDFYIKLLKRERLCDDDATEQDFFEYTYSYDFFDKDYTGKFEKWNVFMRENVNINKLYIPNCKISDVERRKTEWKDLVSINQMLDMWQKFKMVYKVDNDFFHEIKKTENVITSFDTFNNLPFKCFFIDLTCVKDISDFRGVWVYITQDKKTGYIGVNLYMVKGDDHTFFTFYSWYKFTEKDKEIEWSQENLPKSDFTARTFKMATIDAVSELETAYRTDGKEHFIVNQEVKLDEYDPRNDIVVAIYQIMSFISIDASDVSENPHTKQSYKPSTIAKNKFSEVRMWDVGIRYGKAIHVAKQEYERRVRELKEKEDSDENKEIKERKPTRPHIRRAHWHRYRVGHGRQQMKTIWVAPIYVCGGKEIPVTIREVMK